MVVVEVGLCLRKDPRVMVQSSLYVSTAVVLLEGGGGECGVVEEGSSNNICAPNPGLPAVTYRGGRDRDLQGVPRIIVSHRHHLHHHHRHHHHRYHHHQHHHHMPCTAITAACLRSCVMGADYNPPHLHLHLPSATSTSTPRRSPGTGTTSTNLFPWEWVGVGLLWGRLDPVSHAHRWPCAIGVPVHGKPGPVAHLQLWWLRAGQWLMIPSRMTGCWKIKLEIPSAPVMKPNAAIPRTRCPSLEHFRTNNLLTQQPVILEGIISHWPALNHHSWRWASSSKHKAND
ncbi:LOW QUALITY PROTEIN: hypothetical protein CRUP_006085 [Coryphaenoides rupestris]|nr:LOW QUALITY PROTEIN: hypothetical protein CRUP_006085 [Coryphaenoides rupestris]